MISGSIHIHMYNRCEFLDLKRILTPICYFRMCPATK